VQGAGRGAAPYEKVAERGLCVGLVELPRFVWGEGSQPQTVPAAPEGKARTSEATVDGAPSLSDARSKPGMTKEAGRRN
jgi:hypothetical protein